MSSHVFLNTATGRIFDIQDPKTGRTAINGYSLAEVNEREGGACQVMTWDEAERFIKQADRRRYCRGAQPVTPEQADDALNVLPPFRWHTSDGFEVFAISEPITDRLVSWFVRVGRQWYQLNENRDISYAGLFELVSQAAPAGEA